MRAGDGQFATLLLECGLVLGRVGHVLTNALLASAAQVDDGRDAGEVRGDRLLEALELVGLDLQREVRELVVGRHEREP